VNVRFFMYLGATVAVWYMAFRAALAHLAV
jgi:hypothetical protein